MPVVLTTAPGVRRSGHVYDDKTGIAYEFPGGRYERWIETGERFLYCEPKKGYFGCGVIGVVKESGQAGRRIAEILSYEPFPAHVSIVSQPGSYYEEDPTYWKGPVYWAQGVRPISDETLEAILTSAEATTPQTVTAGPASAPSPTKPAKPRAEYASPEIAKAVELYSVARVMARLQGEFPEADVHEMPRNNPGFDIRVGPVDHPLLYVEVKGTQSAEPVFFLSEGERSFSCHNADRYRLEVVVGVDLKLETHQATHTRLGAIAPQDCSLKPTQWRGSLPLEPGQGEG
jgi:hypothetical protein